MNPDQTAPFGPYCLLYSLPKNNSRLRADNKSHDWHKKGKNEAISLIFLV